MTMNELGHHIARMITAKYYEEGKLPKEIPNSIPSNQKATIVSFIGWAVDENEFVGIMSFEYAHWKNDVGLAHFLYPFATKKEIVAEIWEWLDKPRQEQLTAYFLGGKQ